MKTLLKSMVLIASLFSITTAFATTTSTSTECFDNIKITYGNWENEMPDSCILMINGNLLVVHVFVRVADLNLSSYSDLYLRYNFNGMLVGTSDQLTAADFAPVNINGYNLYEAEFVFTIDLSDECTSQPYGVPLDFDYSFKLVTFKAGSGAVIYPVHDHPGLFPPAIFTELLDPEYEPIYQGSKEICCTDLTPLTTADSDQKPQGSPEMAQASLYAEEEIAILPRKPLSNMAVQLFPNPFQDKLTVQLQLNEATKVHYRLLDANGKQVYERQVLFSEAGIFEELLHLPGLQAGVYYLQLVSDTSTQTHKIIRFE